MREMTYTANALTTVSPQNNLSQYLREIRKFPLLEKEEEQSLACRWFYHKDQEAAHTLVTSHLRLVAKIATGYKGYGLPMSDLVSEGNIGLMQAVKKFDPRKGFRLATYAMWWIRASIQEFILKSWSLVKIGTTASQKKLFFNLRKLKGKMEAFEEGDLNPDQVSQIANELNVSEDDVVNMNRRMAGSDHSLNAPLKIDGNLEWQDWLTDENASDQESQAIEKDEFSKRHVLLQNALSGLKDREREIFIERRLSDETKTLEELSQTYDISRERVRQIEARAYEKVQKLVQSEATEQNLI